MQGAEQSLLFRPEQLWRLRKRPSGCDPEAAQAHWLRLVGKHLPVPSVQNPVNGVGSGVGTAVGFGVVGALVGEEVTGAAVTGASVPHTEPA
jgi:hypothetical protein